MRSTRDDREVGSGWSVRRRSWRDLHVAVELDTVGAGTAEQAQQLRLGEGDREVGFLGPAARMVSEDAVGQLHPVGLAGVAEVPAFRGSGIPGAIAVEVLGDGQCGRIPPEL